MIKNLITGIGGFVASHLADYLIQQGEEVYGTYRWFEETDRVKHLIDNPKFHMIPMDLNDLSSCIKAISIKPNYIFHLAAQSYVSESFDYPHATIETNTLGTLNLLEAIRFIIKKSERDVWDERISKEVYESYNPTIHLCSSSEVYGLVKEEDIPIKESQAFNPANPYAVGKVGLDMLGLMYYNNYGLKIIRTRMFTHTGPRRTMMSAECNFARQIALIEKGRQEPLISHGNLESIRTWADVRDAVRAYYRLVRDCKPGEVYNIGGNTQKTIEEMLDYLISLSSAKEIIKKKQDPNLMRHYDVTLQVPDVSKFEKETKWKQKYTFEKTMEDLLNFWRENV